MKAHRVTFDKRLASQGTLATVLCRVRAKMRAFAGWEGTRDDDALNRRVAYLWA
jgi:hypothetical protein